MIALRNTTVGKRPAPALVTAVILSAAVATTGMRRLRPAGSAREDAARGKSRTVVLAAPMSDRVENQAVAGPGAVDPPILILVDIDPRRGRADLQRMEPAN